MKRSKLKAVLGTTGFGCVIAIGLTSGTMAQDRGPDCDALAGMEIAASVIGLPTGGAKVLEAMMAAPTPAEATPDGEFLRGIVERCQVSGQILPVDAAAPPILFNVNLPLNWNGKALQSGGGGLGGSVITAPGKKAHGRIDPVPLDQPYPLEQGYVTFGGDGGHQGTQDPSFAYNDEALRNWAGDALVKTKDAALAVIEAAYGAAPDYVYFTGESAGGREGLWLAQNHPEDYDGIMATSPVLAWYYAHLADVNIRDHLVTDFLDAAAISLVAEHTRKTCDEADGLADGIIARYLECPNNVADLLCAEAQESGCLSHGQIRAVNAIRNPWSLPFPLAYGQTRYAGLGVTGGEDGTPYQWDFYTVGTVPPSRELPAGRGFEEGVGAILNFGSFLVRHTIVGDETFDPLYFDPRPYRERIQYLSELFDAMNPDLSAFAAAGGKLVIMFPTADNALGTPMMADYRNAVHARLGEAETDAMFKLYMGHGGGHNVTGPSQTDLLSVLDGWVAGGTTPPDELLGVQMNKDLEVERAMPICTYPAYARYDGTGDPDDAASFTCTDRADPMGFSMTTQ